MILSVIILPLNVTGQSSSVLLVPTKFGIAPFFTLKHSPENIVTAIKHQTFITRSSWKTKRQLGNFIVRKQVACLPAFAAEWQSIWLSMRRS